LAAANTIISRAVPTVSKVIPETVVPGRKFVRGDADKGKNRDNDKAGSSSLSYYERATVSAKARGEHDGRYHLVLQMSAKDGFVDGVNDYNRCRVQFRADGVEIARRELGREDGKTFWFECDQDWKAGPHTLTVEVEPLTPDEKQVRALSLRIRSA